jgi:hypothetical protein
MIRPMRNQVDTESSLAQSSARALGCPSILPLLVSIERLSAPIILYSDKNSSTVYCAPVANPAG